MESPSVGAAAGADGMQDSQPPPPQQAAPCHGLQKQSSPLTKSPSPPASTCRRLSYESAQTRSNTRPSSRSASQPAPQQQQQSLRAMVGVQSTAHQVHSPLSTNPSTGTMPSSTPPRAAATSQSPGTPAAQAAAVAAASPNEGLKRGTASSPKFVPYSSLPPSPSSAVTTTIAGSPSQAIRNNVSAAVGAEAEVKAAGQLHREEAVLSACGVATHTHPSRVTPHGENSKRLQAPLASPPLNKHGCSDAVVDDALLREQQKNAVVVVAATFYTAPAVSACTPPNKGQHPQHVSSPCASSPQRRSPSASSGARGRARCMQPAPSLRAGAAGPSPFAVEKLAMPRRPLLPPPQVQLARPSGLNWHNQTTASTSMAASQLPGAAAAHNRLQVPQKSRLVRTTSAVGKCGGAGAAALDGSARRRAPSASAAGSGTTPASPFKRRSSTASGVAKGAAAAATTTSAAATKLHQRTPSGTFAVYTTRGGEAAGSRALRSSSAPTLRRPPSGGSTAKAGKDVDTAVPAILRSSSRMARRLHVSGGGSPSTSAARAGASSPPGTAAAAASRDRIARTRTASASRIASTSSTAAAALGNGSREGGSPKVRRAPSASTVTTPALSREPSRFGDRSSRVGAAPGGLTHRTPATRSISGIIIGGARPTISAGSGTYTQRTRPVVSTSSHASAASSVWPSGAATRRARATANNKSAAACHGSNSNSIGNTVSAAQSSMITMEESREFLQEFQRMNQRELALFGTLLATAASEQQQQQQQRRAVVTTGVTADNRVPAPPRQEVREQAGRELTQIVVQSAEEVSVWTCKRPSLEMPQQQQQQQEEAAAGIPLKAGDSFDPAREAAEATTTTTTTAVTPLDDYVHQQQSDTNGNTEVVVLVRRSRSRASPSQTPSPSRRLDLDSCDKEQQQQLQRSPSPTPNVPVTTHAAPQATGQVGGNYRHTESPEGANSDSGDSSRGGGEASPSGQAAVPHLRDGAATTTATAVSAQPPVGRGGVRGSTGLRQRSANDANIASTTSGAGAASAAAVGPKKGERGGPSRTQKVSNAAASAVVGKAGRNGDIAQRPPTSLHSSRSRRRRRGCGEVVTRVHLAQEQLPQRHRSVMSYSDMRSYSRSEDRPYVPIADSGGHHNGEGVACGVVREYSPEGGEDGHCAGATADVVKDTPPPLAALRRVKELAAEQAAALVQRQRERQQHQQQQVLSLKENGNVDGEAARACYGSPSVFSSCGSPSGSSVGRPSSALAMDVTEVRLSAAQLQLLIDGSRSRQNWQRYQQL